MARKLGSVTSCWPWQRSPPPPRWECGGEPRNQGVPACWEGPTSTAVNISRKFRCRAQENSNYSGQVCRGRGPVCGPSGRGASSSQVSFRCLSLAPAAQAACSMDHKLCLIKFLLFMVKMFNSMIDLRICASCSPRVSNQRYLPPRRPSQPALLRSNRTRSSRRGCRPWSLAVLQVGHCSNYRSSPPVPNNDICKINPWTVNT